MAETDITQNRQLTLGELERLDKLKKEHPEEYENLVKGMADVTEDIFNAYLPVFKRMMKAVEEMV